MNLSFFYLLLERDFLIVALSAIAAFATIVTLGLPYMQKDVLEGRMKAVAERREELRQKQRDAFAQGNRSKGQLRSTPVVFIGAMIYVFGVSSLAWSFSMKLLASVAAALFGYYLPDIFVSNRIQARQGSIMRAFPDALDLMLICVESGMSVEAAFNRVAGEVGSQSVELAEELGLTTAELSYLPDRRQAFQNLAERCGHSGVKAVAAALIQSEKYGTPMGTALRVTAAENREMRMAEAERKAGSLPSKLTVPMIVFFLPCLFVVILGPAALKVMGLVK